MKTIINVLALLFLFTGAYAQSHDLAPCGTQSYRSEWLKSFQKDPNMYDTRSVDVLYVPMTVHFVGTDTGTGLYKEFDLVRALCTLNDDFIDADIQFFIKGEINHIYNSAWANHPTVLVGAEMMFANNITGTLNCYVMDNPAGNCGYNLPYAGIALSDNCLSPSDHTWSHEIGHAFSLPHPFLGWEGGVGHDGTIPHSFNNPAPEKVLFNYTYFKDTLILDTIIIDTAYVELLDGSNCNIAADGFCDTKADYLASRWACDASTSLSQQEQTDPTGAKFYSDASLIMSYSLDYCSYRFTEEQIGAMRANLIDEKPELLQDQTHPGDLSTEAPEINYPLAGESTLYTATELSWEPVANATNYLVQLNLASGGVFSIYDTIVSGNQVVLPPAEINKTFFWRVKALGKTDFCNGKWSADGSFTATETSSTAQVDTDDYITIYPTLLHAGDKINIITKGNQQIEELILIDASGRIITSESIYEGGVRSLDSSLLKAGIYFVMMQVDGKSWSSKIAITE